ncbi:MAG: hypothetical protein IBJ11_12200 [Phycisphaerales bacterium]|nr:hypothetical protein [Phycisphaerales bacterium]
MGHRVRMSAGLAAAAGSLLAVGAAAQVDSCGMRWIGERGDPGYYQRNPNVASARSVAEAAVWSPGDGGPDLLLTARPHFTTNGAVDGIAAWDGRRWTRFPSGGRSITDVIVAGGRLLGLESPSGRTWDSGRRVVIEWDGQCWNDLPMQPSQADADVTAVASIDGRLHMALLGRGEPTRIVRWNGEAWEPLGPPIWGRVRAMTGFNGDVVVGGDDIRFDDTFSQPLARLTPDGWKPFESIRGSDVVNSLTIWEGRLVAAGRLSIDGSPVLVAAFDGETWRSLREPALGDFSEVESVNVFEGRLLAVSSWTGEVLRLDERGWTSLKGLSGWVTSLGPVFRGEQVVLGLSMDIGGRPAGSMVRWSGGSWKALWQPSGFSDQAEFFRAGSRFLALNGPRYIGDRYAAGMAEWDGRAWQPVLSNPPEWIGQLAAVGSEIYTLRGTLSPEPPYGEAQVLRLANGRWEPWSPVFPASNGARMTSWRGELLVNIWDNANTIAKVTPAGFEPIPGDFRYGPYPGFTWLYTAGDRLIATGLFSRIDGQPAEGIASWDGQRWTPLDRGGGFREFAAFAEFRGDLYAGGTALYRWADEGWVLITGSELGNGALPIVPFIYTLTVMNDRLIAGGRFRSVGGVAASGLAEWDGSGWRALNLAPGEDEFVYVNAAAEFNGSLFVSGWFTHIGGVLSPWVARMSPSPGPADLDGDGAVGASDLAAMLSAFGTVSGTPEFDNRADLDRNGAIGAGDLTIMLLEFGRRCP